MLSFTAAAFLFQAHRAWATESVQEGIAVEGIHSISRDELLYLLGLKDCVSAGRPTVTEGIKRVFLKGIFEDIEVFADGAGKPGCRVVVRERDIIAKVSVKGNALLSNDAIREISGWRGGTVMRYDRIDEAVNDLRQGLAERGFPHAQARIYTERLSEPYSVNVVIEINEGPPDRIRKIRILGPESTAKAMLKTAEGDVYDQVRLKADMEKIKAHYKGMGYLKPSVGPYTYFDGELDISIDRGKKLDIFFEGNAAIDSRDLLKEMPFFEAGDFGDELVEDAARRITTLYHSRGFAFAKVAPVMSSGNDILIRFFIYEGEKVHIGSVRFSGVTLPEENLRSIMPMKEGDIYNPDAMDAERDALKEFYNAIGYLNVEVLDPEVKIEGSAANLLIAIKEGRQTLINSVEVKGALSFSDADIKKAVGLKRGEPYNEVDISNARYRVLDMYSDKGFMDVKIDVKRDVEEKGARLTFEINEGPVTYFGKTIIKGNRKTMRNLIERDLLHSEGTPLNHSLLLKERQRLYKTGLFTDITFEPLNKYDSKRDVLVNVAEGNAGAVELGIGYGDYEKLRGFIDVSYRNLFGMNRQGSFRTELSSLERRFILNYFDPWFLNRPTPFRAVLLNEERAEKNVDTKEISYRLRRQAATAGFEKELNDKFKGELYYDFSIVNTYDVKPDVVLTKEDTGTLFISDFRGGIIFDTRDNPFDPRSGILAGATLKLASGLLFSQVDFVKLIFNGNFYHEISRRFVAGLSVRGGAAQGFGATNELPLVERFFLGGRNTVRGYAQDTLGPKGADGTPTGGNVFLMGNMEMRTSLSKGIGMVAFIDCGNVWLKTKEVNMSLKYTAGIGVRYSTPVGPLRVDYGYKLNREQGDSIGEIHFSIGHAF